MLHKQLVKQPISGITYLLKGMKLLSHPKLRPFIFIPLLINIFIFSSAFWFLFSAVSDWIESYLTGLPDFLSWLSYLLWPFLIISILFVFSFLFSALANFIAAPFNGMLAEKAENILINNEINNGGIIDLIKDLPRIFKRELQKLGYFIPRMLLCGLLFFIPVLGPLIAPFIWLVFAGWMMAVQYADFPFDNHKVPFKTMKNALAKRLTKNLTFGMLISFFTTLPIINLIIMPIAVCGATALWVDIYKEEVLSSHTEIEKK